jgi:hypothetical protein
LTFAKRISKKPDSTVSYPYMKTLLLLFVLFPHLCSAALPVGDFLGSRTCRFERSFYDFRLTKTALEKAPKWNPEDSEFPPMSPKQAQAAGFAQIKKLHPDLHKQMRIYAITLEALYDTDWVYLVTYDYRPLTASTGPPRHFTVPVYLDGSTITPVIRKEKQ